MVTQNIIAQTLIKWLFVNVLIATFWSVSLLFDIIVCKTRQM